MPFLIITSFFVVGGILVLNGKGTFLISGYNRMSKAEKEKYDEAAICKFVGKNDVTDVFSHIP